ncbi:MAG: hypothetical protein CVU56_13195 [Deltaproteobacteria bacterium HGW-Deltaproteobacteria-14]|nr:MAG: hypothetical protein CVU56_13195 [Deltaproteobacteria bacterium HGW-Deltaproteobacteria-14]
MESTENNTAPTAQDHPLTVRVLHVADAVGEFIAWWGFKAIHGRIWALLALSSGPRAQAEVADLLGVSRALVSAAMHELHERGLVRPVGDSRQAPWVAVMDVWPVIADVLRQREWILIERARVTLEAAIEEAELLEAADEHIGFDLDRMRVLLNLTEMAQRFLRILVSLRVPRSIASLGDWLVKATGLLGSLRRLR